MMYNYNMARHFFKLWNSPKSYNNKDLKVEQKIERFIQKIKFKLWSLFRK